MAQSFGSILEGNSGQITFTVQDQDGTGFRPTTLKLSLYDYRTKTIINSRDAVALVVNDEIDASGNLAFDLTIADNVLVDSTKRWERHVARFDITWSSATKAATFEVPYIVLSESDL